MAWRLNSASGKQGDVVSEEEAVELLIKHGVVKHEQEARERMAGGIGGPTSITLPATEKLDAGFLQPTRDEPVEEPTQFQQAKGEASPVADQNAHDAIESVKHMRSHDKLKSIVEGDSRATVKAAAEKRLSELDAGQ